MLRHPNLIAEVHNEVQDFFAKTFANLESHAALELTVSTGEIVCTYIYIYKYWYLIPVIHMYNYQYDQLRKQTRIP